MKRGNRQGDKKDREAVKEIERVREIVRRKRADRYTVG